MKLISLLFIILANLTLNVFCADHTSKTASDAKSNRSVEELVESYISVDQSEDFKFDDFILPTPNGNLSSLNSSPNSSKTLENKSQKEQVPGYPLPHLEKFEKLSDESKHYVLRVLDLIKASSNKDANSAKIMVSIAENSLKKIPNHLREFFTPYMTGKLTKSEYKKLDVYFNAISATIKNSQIKEDCPPRKVN